MEWRKIPVSLSELCLASVLRCGQSFRWKSSGPDEWSCALRGRIITVRQDPTHLYYHAMFPSSPIDEKPDALDDTAELIRDYFNLSVDLTVLYEKWSSRDPHFKKTAPGFAGIRMLRQDPWENLVSFICSSNNNIVRISQMVENLCVNFGPKLGQLNNITYYDFPVPAALTPVGTEEKLRALGFGYRAKYIHQTARMIVDDHPTGWLDGLRNMEYKDAHEALLELQGVGPKVADCVCLMSLDKSEAVPVDTHVWQIAMRDYKFGKGKHKSLTKATYTAIGDHFRELWGNEAGWAHSVLFTADLKAFAEKDGKTDKFTTPTTTSTTVKQEPSADKDTDIMKREVGVTATVARGNKGRGLRAEAKGRHEHGGSIKEEADIAPVKTVKREKRERKVKTEINGEHDREKQGVDAKLATTVEREGKAKMEIKNKGGGSLETQVKVEKSVQRIIANRCLENGNQEVDVKSEDVGATMADRIKRRKRQK